MRVLAAIVAPPHLSESGAVTAGLQLSVALAEHCEMDVALMAEADSETTVGKARVVRQRSTNPLSFTRGLLPNRFRTLLYRAPVGRLIRGGRYDLVHIHNLMPTPQMGRVARAARDAGIPYVVSTHGIVEAVGGPKVYSLNALPERVAWSLMVDRPLRPVFRGAARVLALSPADLPLLATLGVPGSSVSIVPNALDASFLRPVPAEEIDAVLARIGLEGPDAALPLCFFLGNHANTKGIDVLLEAVDRITEPLALVVGGERRDHLDYARWEATSRTGHRVIFPGRLGLEASQALYRRADVFVFPTRADTFPLAVLEAMAYGCPIVTTPVGGIPAQVEGAEAVLVPPGDAAELAGALEAVLKDDGRRRHMAEASERAGARYLGWERSAGLAFDAYRQVLGLG